MSAALSTELLKFRRSTVPLITTVLVCLVIPGLAYGFVSVADGPGQGPMAEKVRAMVIGTGWDAYVGALDQLVAVALFIAIGVVVAWCFGREFADRTAGSLFALPVSRGSIAFSKFVVLMVWSVVVCAGLMLVAMLIGLAAGLGLPNGPAVDGLVKLFAVGLLTALLTMPVALAASIGRGYLPAIGILILMVMAAQVSVLFGAGGWFPYAAPGLWAVSAQLEGVAIGVGQLALVPLVAAVGEWATVRWWNRFEVV
jgi:ABC-2 type transport system permease protein